jgi:hypothetical protein
MDINNVKSNQKRKINQMQPSITPKDNLYPKFQKQHFDAILKRGPKMLQKG